ncbi:pyrroloquinoline quinone precursor peptide PqqA [Actinomadura rugatobispora]|uniref:Coenzyme PQQ synthesis protein A n=1 Tax=Actinomadura rugatobispora TaxID=1994 RepID=A0ABW0ZWM8_9ACTN|nr:hypothetical protein GCM10010200_080580 [Actinomadura rugatobispora]
MSLRGTAPDREERGTGMTDTWITPDYQIVETSLEVTAYLTAED